MNQALVAPSDRGMDLEQLPHDGPARDQVGPIDSWPTQEIRNLYPIVAKALLKKCPESGFGANSHKSAERLTFCENDLA